MTKLDSILKSRDITLATKVHLVKAMVFPVVIYGWELDYKESWAPKNWCFWTMVFEKTLQSSLDYRKVQPVSTKGNQSEDSLEGLMLKLNLQHFGHLMRRADSLEEKTLVLGKIEGKRRRGWQRVGRHHQLNGHELEQIWEMVKDREVWHAAVYGVAKSWTQLSDWRAKFWTVLLCRVVKITFYPRICSQIICLYMVIKPRSLCKMLNPRIWNCTTGKYTAVSYRHVHSSVVLSAFSSVYIYVQSFIYLFIFLHTGLCSVLDFLSSVEDKKGSFHREWIECPQKFPCQPSGLWVLITRSYETSESENVHSSVMSKPLWPHGL